MEESPGRDDREENTTESRALPTSAQSTSLWLLLRAQRGESGAVSALFQRLLPSLARWAHGRLPAWARARMDTGDLVQDALMATFRRLPRIEPRRKKAIRSYLKQSIRNKIRDEMRRAGKVETSENADVVPVAQDPSPLDHVVSLQNTDRYRCALRRLSPGDQELITGRIQLDYSYDQLALATGKASPDAARVAVRRALLRLAEELDAA